MKLVTSLLVAALLCGGLAQFAAAQTARIAHFSHSGSSATLDAAQESADNFGLPTTVYRNLTITLLSDTTVLVQGQHRYAVQNIKDSPWKRFKELIQFRTFDKDSVYRENYITVTSTGTRILSLQTIKQNYPDAKLIGFEKKRKAKCKSSFWTGFYLPQLPQSGSGILFIGLLAGAGWLLRGRARPEMKKMA